MIYNRTLLLSDGFYSEKIVNANEILLKFLTSEFGKDSLFRVILSGERIESNMPQRWNGYRFMVLKRIKTFSFSRFKPISYFVNTFIYLYSLGFIVPRQVAQIKELIKKEKPTKIWIVITSPQLVFVSKRVLIKLKNIQLYTSVWDAPEEFSLLLEMPIVFRKKMLNDFYYLLNNSVKLGVSSTNMKKEYEMRFNKECFVLQGDVTEVKSRNIFSNQTNDYMIFGFAGSIYTPEVWDALFNALDLVAWKLKGKDVKIRIIGNSIVFTPPSHCMIEYFGKQPINKVRDILSDSFLNFVPYRFSEITKYGSSVAFPSKISTYLAAKKPIFTIAPSYSTPSQFVNEYEVGVACNSLLPEDIIFCLDKFILPESNYQKYIHNCEKIYNDSFHSFAFKKTFCEFIK